MPYHAPKDELLDRAGIESLQRRKLGAMLEEVLRSNAFYAGKLAGTGFDAGKDPLERLPLTTRAEIQADQLAHPPYGTNLTYPLSRYHRLHQTSGSTDRDEAASPSFSPFVQAGPADSARAMGAMTDRASATPLRWLDTAESWAWFRHCWKIIFRAAGITESDRILFPFSFGPFIGFWAAFETAADLGNFCLPAGGMTTQARLRHLLDHSANVVCCTPTYALRLAEVAAAGGINLADSPVRAIIVAGEPGGSVPHTRARIEQAFGARVYDHSGMTEIGSCSFECLENPGGVHVIESEFIPEVIDPATGSPIPEGQAGELVLTNLGRWGSPMIRYRTGDQARLVRSRCACGRWFARLEGGILGRTDDMFIVRGNNVFPSTVESLLRSFAEVAEFRAEVDRRAALTVLRLDIEPLPGADGDLLARRIVERFREELLFAPEVAVRSPGSLPRFDMKARRFVSRRV